MLLRIKKLALELRSRQASGRKILAKHSESLVNVRADHFFLFNNPLSNTFFISLKNAWEFPVTVQHRYFWGSKTRNPLKLFDKIGGGAGI